MLPGDGIPQALFPGDTIPLTIPDGFPDAKEVMEAEFRE
jgi:hypothetical protein